MMVPNTSLLVDTRETKELLKLEDSVHILRNGCWTKNKCSLETGTKFLRLRSKSLELFSSNRASNPIFFPSQSGGLLCF